MAEFTAIECSCNGTVMEGTICVPQGSGPRPAVVMFPGASGSGPTFGKRAGELVELGYLVVCADMYEQGADQSTPEAAGKHFMALLDAPEELRARAVAWLDLVKTHAAADPGRVAALGYCFGGKCVLELARSGADLKCVVSYHGILPTHASAQKGGVIAEVVAFCAGQDPFAPMDDYLAFQTEMREAEVTHQLTLFSHAQHSFTDPDHEGVAPGIAYDAQYHRVSWASTLALLDYHLNG